MMVNGKWNIYEEEKNIKWEMERCGTTVRALYVNLSLCDDVEKQTVDTWDIQSIWYISVCATKHLKWATE